MSQTKQETTVEEITRLMAVNKPQEQVLTTPDEQKHGIAIGSTVKLKSTVRKPVCASDRKDNSTAKVSRYMSKFNEPELENYPVMLEDDLHGNRMWNIKDLELA